MNLTPLPASQRVALVIQYLGTHFHGWQRQPNQRTVQAEIERAICSAIAEGNASATGSPVVLHAAGRTDAGVHAAAQVAHFDVVSQIPAHRWMSVLNARLPDDILIRGSAAVDPTWHSRFSASWRRYRYTLYTDPCPNLFVRSQAWHYYYEPLDEMIIQKALDPLIGRHHLAAFHRAGSNRPHSWVDVQETLCQRDGSFIYVEVQASGFLYGMMRLLIGLLVQVGREAISLEEFRRLWTEQCREKVKYAAPAQGLCLLRVGYPDMPFLPNLWFDTQPKLTLPVVSASNYCLT
ncbi:tRNA pseudouridine(38-40) synthase TruA [Myxacorys almedinensis]|uniref:tRNA pseudouridine synthase A n=1 Tax=Myxacorys almedinensis A TaxID=2690445 RepID=A0A8J7Z3Z1_9CYAN|nr:tRNA pseudouridine(38-40) synthase TruA [Myxacorys almedinensis]NDJ19314.1 tRNA pseudouridine(38-40) synthase TruA [Myxacorys almedinensis A]